MFSIFSGSRAAFLRKPACHILGYLEDIKEIFYADIIFIFMVRFTHADYSSYINGFRNVSIGIGHHLISQMVFSKAWQKIPT